MYKLSYFDARGLCEPLRMMLEIAGVEYEDIRFPIITAPPQIPPEIKKNCRWGQVPILEFDGKQLAQSHAIGRYLAKTYGLAGKNDFESACCDEYCDTVREMMQAWVPEFIEKDAEKKAELRKSLWEKMDEKYLCKFEEILEVNGGWLSGDGMTWADISLAHFIQNVEIVTGDVKLADKWPAVKKMYEKVFAHPKIKAWVAKRPTTMF